MAVDQATLKSFFSRNTSADATGYQGNGDLNLLDKRQKITEELQRLPYDLVLYLKRSSIHAELGYPDLAVGDSYRALLLCDECKTEEFEYHKLAWSTLRRRLLNNQNSPDSSCSQADFDQSIKLDNSMISSTFEEGFECDESHMILEATRTATLQCYRNLSIGLLRCQCLKSAHEFCLRGLAMAPDDAGLLQLRDEIQATAKNTLKGVNKFATSQLPDEGWVRREIYPWNHHEPDRFSAQTLDSINQKLALVAPKCEARVTDLFSLQETSATDTSISRDKIPKNKQLGLFAREKIQPNETVLDEFSLLVVNNRLEDSLCDACCVEIPHLQVDSVAVSCQECYDISFCSKTCLDMAQQEYHPAVCGKDVHMVAKDPKPKDKPHALYFLLLCRVLAMSSTREIHPLDSPYVKHIWGDFRPSEENAQWSSCNHPGTSLVAEKFWSLPFSFKYNVVEPLHILEKMDIDIYANLIHYDLWIFNTLCESNFRWYFALPDIFLHIQFMNSFSSHNPNHQLKSIFPHSLANS